MQKYAIHRHRRNIMRRILEYMKPYKLYLIIAVISALISVTANIAIPVFIGKAIDAIVGTNAVNFDTILKNVIVILILIAFNLTFSLIMTLCTNRITYLTVRDLREAVFSKLN